MKNIFKNKKIKILSILILLVLFGISFFNFHKISEKKLPPPNLPLIRGEVTKTVLEINGQHYEDEIATEISVYDFMSKLRGEGKINFTEKDYAGMGKFIVSINGIKNNGDGNWIYYVNGIEAQVGVSNYKINPGDVISWKYEKFNY